MFIQQKLNEKESLFLKNNVDKCQKTLKTYKYFLIKMLISLYNPYKLLTSFLKMSYQLIHFHNSSGNKELLKKFIIFYYLKKG